MQVKISTDSILRSPSAVAEFLIKNGSSRWHWHGIVIVPSDVM